MMKQALCLLRQSECLLHPQAQQSLLTFALLGRRRGVFRAFRRRDVGVMITLITRNVRLRTIVLVIIHGVMTVLRASQRADVPAGVVLRSRVVIRSSVVRGVNISVLPGR